MDARIPPPNVAYSLLPLGTKAVAKSRKFSPNNGAVFTPANNVCRIPLNTSGFIDGQHSYLSFQTEFTSTAAAATAYIGWDCTAQSAINQIRIEGSDGAELERISSYNVLVNAMQDLQIGVILNMWIL